MTIMRKFIVYILVFCVSTLVCAQRVLQSSPVEVNKMLRYRQAETPSLLDNYLYMTLSAGEKAVYNLKGFALCTTSKPIVGLAVNPAGSSYAVLCRKKNKAEVIVYGINKTNEKLVEYKNVISPCAIAYSSDSKNLYIASEDKILHVYDSKSEVKHGIMPLPIAPQKMVASPNGYYLAIAKGTELLVVNLETGDVRMRIYAESDVRDMDFSDDSSMLAFVTNSQVAVYDTREFQLMQEYSEEVTGGVALSFHPDNKYIAVAMPDNVVSLLNVNNVQERLVLSDPMNGVGSYVRFVKDGKSNVYLSHAGKDAIIYKILGGVSKNYSKLLRNELSLKMEEWSRIRDGESLDEYRNRVNDDTRLAQAKLFEEEIATRMAKEYLPESQMSLGGYNPENRMLTLEFDNMPPMYLTVPEDEVKTFMNPADLELRNPVYGIGAADKFELVYAEVYNKSTGKTYEFDNKERRSLDFLSMEDDFVPIELVRQSGMEEMTLNQIKRNVVDKAMSSDLISDHTHIDVRTSVFTDVDASGSKVNNYKVAFNYTVEGKYSIKDDFAPGAFKVEESNAAMSMLEIVIQAFERDFAQYLKPGKKVRVNITGTADALPIRGVIGYDGCYGEFVEEPYYVNKELSNLSVTKHAGIKENTQLAFMRAIGVRRYIERSIVQLDAMNTEYNCYVEVSDKAGSQYRRINIEFIFIDAFN